MSVGLNVTQMLVSSECCPTGLARDPGYSEHGMERSFFPMVLNLEKREPFILSSFSLGFVTGQTLEM